MARTTDKRGGLISHGTCEGCKVDLGNRLDPYCWDCATHLERAVDQRREERLRERLEELLYRALA